jgi:single-stranded DNA-binding protein
MTSRFKHENVIKIDGVLAPSPAAQHCEWHVGRHTECLHQLRATERRWYEPPGERATLRRRVGKQAEKVARLLSKRSKIRVLGRMIYPSWKDTRSGETRYGAEIVATTLDYLGADEAEAPQAEQPTETAASAEQPTPAKPRRSRRKKAQTAK